MQAASTPNTERPRRLLSAKYWGRLLPGLLLTVLIAWLSLYIAKQLGEYILRWQGLDPSAASSPVSAVLVAILLGMLIRNTVGLPRFVQPGIDFSLKTILRLGIVFIGIKLSLLEILAIGLWGIPIVAVSITAGMLLVNWLNSRLHLPERLGTLIAAGTGICGITAIVSIAPSIRANQQEVAYAAANITLFGVFGMFLYPYLAPLFLQTSEQIGVFLGIAVHETAQVMGAALTMRDVFGDEIAFQVATVTKLTRNLFLAAVIPVLTIYYRRREQRQAAVQGMTQEETQRSKAPLLPGFILGFLLLAVLRTLGDVTAAGGSAFGLLAADTWKTLIYQVGDVWGAQYLLGSAMAGVGLNTSFAGFRSVGIKPFLVGLAGAAAVGAVGFLAAQLLGNVLQI